jgi:hypothetical protein
MWSSLMSKRPRNIGSDILDCLETAAAHWTKQRKSEERHPGNVRYRQSRMIREARMTQKDAAWQVMVEAYMKASTQDTLPASSRQIYYQARPKIMAMTNDKELVFGYFSQTLLPNYIEETGVDWDVIYDARGHFEEPHTNRRIGRGTLEVRDYLREMKDADIVPADFEDANVDVIGPSGNISGILFCEKEGFNPLFRAVKLANHYDLMIVSTKGVSVTAARRLIDHVCGNFDLPLFVLHDFDVSGFVILATLRRDTRRYKFSSAFEVIDLGLRLEDIGGLEREPAAPSKLSPDTLRAQLAANGASAAEIDILLDERVELNALTSGDLVAMIERKLRAYGLEKVVPNEVLLAKTYRAFDRSQRLREKFKEMQEQFDKEAAAAPTDIPEDLEARVRAVLAEHTDLRWDDATQCVLDPTLLSRVRAEKGKAERKCGDFTSDSDDDGGA